MKKKISRKVIFSLIGGLATVMAFVTMPLATMAAGTTESCTIYHHHTEACNGTVYVEQTCDGTSWLRTVATDTCTLCGDYHDYYQYDGSCSCGKTWYSTGHACINSPEGSNHGTCSNYSKINCDTTHSHPTTQIVCGKTESTPIGTITVTRSSTEPMQNIILTAAYSGNLENVTFSWKGTTAGKQLTVTKNGAYLLYVSYTEGGVNYVQKMSVEVDNIDTEAPLITRLIPDITTPVSGSVRIKVLAMDNVGLPAKYVSWNGDDFAAEDTLEVHENGVYQVRVRDLANNISSAEILINNIDNEKPVIKKIEVSTMEYTSDEVVLSVDAEDNMPWPNRYISWNDGEYTSDRHFPVDENGLYTVRVMDAAGNFTEEDIWVRNIDKEAPEILELKANIKIPTSKDIILSVTAEDNAEMPEKYISWNSGAYGSATTFKVSANGTYKVQVKDMAGNISEKSIVVSNIDKESPKIVELKANITAPTSKDVILSVKAADNMGMPEKYISWNLGSYGSATTYKVSANGTYKVRVRDEAGNITEKSITISNIDKTAPVINALKADNDKPTFENVILQLDAEDKGGFPEKYIEWNGGALTDEKTFEVHKNGTYEVKVIDKAGNSVTQSIKITNIDKVAPVISSLTATPELWYSGECKVRVDAKDGADNTSDYMISGLHSKAYSWDDGQTWIEDSEYVITEEGMVTVLVRDVAGNISKASVEVKKSELPTIPEDSEEDSEDNSEEDSEENEEDDSQDNSEGSSEENTEDDSQDNSEDNPEDNSEDHSIDDSKENSESGESMESTVSENESQDAVKQEFLTIPDGNNISSEPEEETEDIIIEIVEKEEESYLMPETPEEPDTIEQKDSRAFRGLGKILIAILGCLGFLLLGFILFILLGMCRVYCVSAKLKEIYLGSVGISLKKGGFKIKIGDSILEEAESRNIRIKIPGWFVKLFAYKPLLIEAVGETIEKYVEQEIDIHINA